MFTYNKKAGFIKLFLFPGKATPSPPVGSMLGQRGLNIFDFCKNFNESTKHLDSSFFLPVIINYYSDKTYKFFFKNPTISFYLKKIFCIENFNINFFNILNLVKFKFNDFNSFNFYCCLKIVLGVLKSMKISFLNDW